MKFLRALLVVMASVAMFSASTSFARDCLQETGLKLTAQPVGIWTGVMETSSLSSQRPTLCRVLVVISNDNGSVKAIEAWGANSVNTVNAGSFEFTGKIAGNVLSYTWPENGATSTYTFRPDGNVKMDWRRMITLRNGDQREVAGNAELIRLSPPEKITSR